MNIPQQPAEGIMAREGNDLNMQSFHVECSCTDEGHALNVWIEFDREDDWPEPQVTFYVQTCYPTWRGFFHRLKDAVGIVFGQPLTREHSILFSKQSAINFAATLNKSIEEMDADSTQSD
jgi:hypothetical protein